MCCMCRMCADICRKMILRFASKSFCLDWSTDWAADPWMTSQTTITKRSPFSKWYLFACYELRMLFSVRPIGRNTFSPLININRDRYCRWEAFHRFLQHSDEFTECLRIVWNCSTLHMASNWCQQLNINWNANTKCKYFVQICFVKPFLGITNIFRNWVDSK